MDRNILLQRRVCVAVLAFFPFHARKAAEDLKSAAGAFAEEYRGKAEQAWGDARGKAEQAWGDATSRVRTFQEDAEQYVRENPTKAVFTALGIGFVLGLIFRR